MEIENAPRRAIRKFRKDGFQNLCQEGKGTLLEDFLLYEIFYKNYLQNHVNIVGRDELRQWSQSEQYDGFSDSMRLKGLSGFRGSPNPAKYEPGGRFVSEVTEATILGPIGPALTPDGSVIADSIGTPPLSPRRTGVTLARSITKNGMSSTRKALSGKSNADQRLELATLAVPPWNNYYHWTVECLIRIRLLEKYGSETGRYPVLLVPAERTSWMEESLRLMDYSGEIASIDNGIVKVDKLVVPTFPDPIPCECSWIRERVLREVGCDDEATGRIYISRKDATVRRLSNEREIRPILEDYNIETYILSDLTVEEQVELFNRAELVLSPHGAGLTNILYGDDLSILELFGNKTMATFDRIAENMEHEYWYLKCEQDGVDIRVDPDQLDQKLDSILK